MLVRARSGVCQAGCCYGIFSGGARMAGAETVSSVQRIGGGSQITGVSQRPDQHRHLHVLSSSSTTAHCGWRLVFSAAFAPFPAPMSGLLSSLVQPVVRQARRFSAAPADSGDGAQTTLSHVSAGEDSTSAACSNGRSGPAVSDRSDSSFDQLRNHLPRTEFIQRLRRLVIPSAATNALWSEYIGSALARDADNDDNAHHDDSNEDHHDGSHAPFRDRNNSLSSSSSAASHRNLAFVSPSSMLNRTRPADGRPGQPPRQGTTSSNSTRSRRNTARFTNSNSTEANVSSNVSAIAVPRQLRESNETASIMAGSLPEDDGMAELRRKIHDIRDMAASSEEKAQRMHRLMTAEYAAHRQLMRPSSPASMVSAERPFTPSSPQSDFIATPATSPPASRASVAVDPSNPFNVTQEDLQPCYRPKPDNAPVEGGPDGDHTEEDHELGCAHYKRNVKVQCFDCRLWFSCRHCHDAQADHKLNRRLTENMLCMLCQTPQPAGPTCVNCEMETSCYYCGICKLWDDDSTKRIYHCPDCGICRRGEGLGKDYMHCKVRETAPIIR